MFRHLFHRSAFRDKQLNALHAAFEQQRKKPKPAVFCNPDCLKIDSECCRSCQQFQIAVAQKLYILSLREAEFRDLQKTDAQTGAEETTQEAGNSDRKAWSGQVLSAERSGPKKEALERLLNAARDALYACEAMQEYFRKVSIEAVHEMFWPDTPLTPYGQRTLEPLSDQAILHCASIHRKSVRDYVFGVAKGMCPPPSILYPTEDNPKQTAEKEDPAEQLLRRYAAASAGKTEKRSGRTQY